jgi:hypothetical protein
MVNRSRYMSDNSNDGIGTARSRQADGHINSGPLHNNPFQTIANHRSTPEILR